MALYQYQLITIPAKGLLKENGSIPPKLNVDSVKGYYGSIAFDYWKTTKVEIETIPDQIDKYVKRTNWGNDSNSFNWKTYHESLDNDAAIYLDKDTGKIKEFTFRADLRSKEGLIFLKNMIQLVKQYDLILMDRKGVLMQPKFEIVLESIKSSNAYNFLKDPIKFLENLTKE